MGLTSGLKSKETGEPDLCNVMALNCLTLVLEQRPEMEWKPGEMTHQKSPEHIVMAGIKPRVRPEEKGGTPLPTSSESWVALPSTGVSGASSSRSLARLYSTICKQYRSAN